LLFVFLSFIYSYCILKKEKYINLISKIKAVGKFSNSYALVKESFKVLMQQKSLLWFPVLSVVFTILFFISFLIMLFIFNVLEGSSDMIYYIIIFCFYLLSYFIVIFFNTGLITCASMKLNNQETKFSDGLKNSFKNIGKIFIWSLISATVGLILNMISNKSKIVGKVVISIIGMLWTFLTFFVIPVMIFENKNVFKSISESSNLFKRTWGENVITDFSLGFFFMILGLLGLIPFFFLIFLSFYLGSDILLIISFVLLILYWVSLGIISSSLRGIFVVTLYNYAKTGNVSSNFNQEIIQNAFKQEEKKSFF
jgi:hypothetical protein